MAAEDILDLARKLRARKALGRSDSLNRLFDFLVETSAAGARPKEIEVAAAVFGRGTAFDGAQDASVRVAVHRLRKKLDEFYASEGAADPVRLAIPKGEYRVTLDVREPGAASTKSRAPGLRTVLTAILLLNGLLWMAFWLTHGSDREVAHVRRSAPWSQVVESDLPTLLVLGDYYIFGDIDEEKGINRLVREYAINSREDLDAYVMDNPQIQGRYRDLDLHYLPVGVAFALRTIVPILSEAKPAPLRVVTASDLTPEMLKRNNIVYVGYLSSLGLLRTPVFAGSRFRVGDTFDELIDIQSGQRFISQEGGPERGDSSHRDYGYVAAFRGPQGNRIVVIAGTRDTALMQTAEALANPAALRALSEAAHGADSFEGLYEVAGIGRSSLSGRLVRGVARAPGNPWNGAPDLRFPAG